LALSWSRLPRKYGASSVQTPGSGKAIRSPLRRTSWGSDPEELERLVLTSDQSRLQAGIALSAAARITWPPKVRALGRALAAGLMATDDARINTEPLIMAALADIEFPQASLLELLTCHWPRFTKGGGLTAERLISRPSDEGAPWVAGQRIWLPADIGRIRPALRPVGA
jgi:hypothetical protein